MKIYSKIIWEWNGKELVEVKADSYEYSGPLSLSFGGGGGVTTETVLTPAGGGTSPGTGGGTGKGGDPVNFVLDLMQGEYPEPDEDFTDATQQKEPDDYSNVISNDANIPVIYGKRMTGGHIVHIEVSDENKYLHVWHVLCEGEIERIDDVYINGFLYRQNGSVVSGLSPSLPEATQEDFVKFYSWQPQEGDSTADIHKARYGTDSQAYCTTNQTSITQWTEDHKGSGLVVVPIRYEWNREAFTRIPKAKFVVRGKKVYDFRNKSTAYSTNPVLHLWDYLTDTRYGCGLLLTEIDGGDKYIADENDTTSSFAVVANLCDADITLYDSTTGDRWIGNTTIDTSQSQIDNVKKLLSAFGGNLIWQQGKYHLEMETTGSTAVFDFTENHIIGGIGIQGEAKRSRFNRVYANYINEDSNYERDTVYWPEADTYLDADNGTPLETTLNLGCITDKYRATNMCKRFLLRSRTQKIVSFLSSSEGYNVTAGDLISITHSSVGFTTVLFRVSKMVMNLNGTVQIVAKEHNDAIYSENTNSAFTASTLSNLPDPLKATPPTNIDISEALFEVIQSAGVHNRITVSWDASNNLFTDHYEWQYKKSSEADSEYKLGGTTKDTSSFVDDLENTEYTFRVRSINASGAKSTYVSDTHNVIGLQAIPADVTNFSANVLDGNVYLTWSKPTDLDVKIAGKLIIKFQDVTSGASWTAGRLISPDGFAPSDTVAITEFMKAGTYMAKWEDSTENSSANAVSSIIFASTVQHLNTVTNDTVSPAFTGTYSNTLVDDNKLKFTGADVIFGGTDLTSGIELTGATASLTEAVYGTNHDSEVTVSGDITFDGGSLPDQWWVIGLRNGETYASIDQQNTTGSFISDAFDLGATYSARITSVINFSFSQTSVRDTIDNLAPEAKIDDITDWDTLTYGVDDINVQTYVRTTNDNPASSPTWTDWERFLTGDFSARAYQWKIEIESGDTYHQVNINEFKMIVDLPDMTKNGSGTSSTGADTTVTFTATPRFYATPNVGITVSNMSTGDYYAITSKTNTGFIFNAYNSGGSRVARNFEYIAKGY